MENFYFSFAKVHLRIILRHKPAHNLSERPYDRDGSKKVKYQK